MKFIEHQDQARKKTKLLVTLFLLAVLVIVIVTNLAVIVVTTVLQNHHETSLTDATKFVIHYSWQSIGLTSILVIGMITCAAIFKSITLRKGGHRLAEALGGRPIAAETDDLNERKILNVVAEMAIASGMPVPDVYILQWEFGINAFAAGHCPSDAVIGVTRGCINQLNRDQLQGVIAHEFSHILNGDMHLNLRLIALLHGIAFVGHMGHHLLGLTSIGASARITKLNAYSTTLLTAAGFGLILIGGLGSFLGSLIRAAVVQQREYLADAAAVQFTRNPHGISEALKIIGGFHEGSEIFNIHAIETSHLFFTNALLRPTLLTSTHPPIAERIRRIEPNWDGRYIGSSSQRQQIAQTLNHVSQQTKNDAKNRAKDNTKDSAKNNSKNNAKRHSNLVDRTADLDFMAAAILGSKFLSKPEKKAMHEIVPLTQSPLTATALCYTVLLNADSVVKATQIDYLEKAAPPGTLNTLERNEAQINSLPDDSRLALIELSFPCLRQLSHPQYLDFKQNLIFMIKADQKISILEWCIYQLIRHYCDKHFNVKPSKVKNSVTHKNPRSIAEPFQIVLSMLVNEGSHDHASKARAFNVGANQVGLYALTLIPRDSLTIDALTHAVNTLAACSPKLKENLIKAFIASAKFDNQLSAAERSIITSVAAAMDAPLGRELLRSIK